MSGHGIRNGATARLVEALANGPLHRDQLAQACDLRPGLVTQRLLQRAKWVGDVQRTGVIWSRVANPPPRVPKARFVNEAPVGKRAAVGGGKAVAPALQEAVTAAQRTPDEAVRDRASREIVCEVATSRTYSAPGEYRPPRMVIREGAFDYLATPTRVGNARLPYRGASNMSTTAIAAGPRSGLK